MKKALLVVGMVCMGTLSAFSADSTLQTIPKELGAPATNDLSKPGVLEAAAASVTATVDAIDYKTRAITLKGEDGNLVTMVAGPEITRFEEVKKGDIVQVDYLEAVALMVQAPDPKIASIQGSNSVIVRNHGKKPSGMAVQTDVITATVEKVDAKKRTATLKGPTGNKLDVDVAPDVQNLENVKKGDLVLVKVTRTVALDIHKPTKVEKKATQGK